MAVSLNRLRPLLGALLIPGLAVLVTALLFGVFVSLRGCDPFEVGRLMFKGAFGTWFSWQNTLIRAAPLMLTALCTALPARVGLIVIGGEGALVAGGVAAAVAGSWVLHMPPWLALLCMCVAGALVGGLWIALAGILRTFRGVNETISSLLLNYIAIAILNQLVEGILRDPASLNKPSTVPLADDRMLPTMFGSEVHWGFGFGVVACIACWMLMNLSTFGFSARMLGGNPRAAQLNGFSIGRIVIITCAIAGAAAGLAGAVEVVAVQGCASASLAAGYGYMGILVAFLSRHQPLMIIPISIVLGGIVASGGLLQRHLHLPDATVTVLQGMLFINILASETLYNRWRWFDTPSAPATSPQALLLPMGEPPAKVLEHADTVDPNTVVASPAPRVTEAKP